MKLLNILIISVLTFFCASTLNAVVYTWTDEKVCERNKVRQAAKQSISSWIGKGLT